MFQTCFSLLVPATCHLTRELPLRLLATLVYSWCSAGLLGVSQVPAGSVRGKRPDFGAQQQQVPLDPACYLMLTHGERGEVAESWRNSKSKGLG